MNKRYVAVRFVSIIAFISLFWNGYCANDFNISDTEIDHHRQKRNLPLVFPKGGTFKLLLGWGIPIKNPANINLVFAFNFQYQFAVPPNVTIFTKYYPYVTLSRKKRSDDDVKRYEQDRLILYKTIESNLEKFGINGRECLLRTICEAAEIPINDNGYVGELFHLLLSPRSNIFSDNQLDGGGGDGDYGAARLAGEQMFDCRELYPECPMGHGLFDLISVLE